MDKTQEQKWLTETFEFEYCHECGGDAEHHEVLNVFGNPFARCKFEPNDDGSPHPEIQEFRTGQNQLPKSGLSWA